MIRNFYFIILLFSFAIHAQSNAGRYVLRGEVSNAVDGQMLYLLYNFVDGQIRDSVRISDGKFVIEGMVDYPSQVLIINNRAQLTDSKTSTVVYFENKEMDVKFDMNDLSKLVLMGSKSQDEHRQIEDFWNGFNWTAHFSAIANLRSQLEDAADTDRDGIASTIDSLNNYADKKVKAYAGHRLSFFKNNPGSYVAPYSLHSLLRSRQGSEYYKEIVALYDEMDEKVKHSIPGKWLGTTIQNYGGSMVGSKAPEFSVSTLTGEQLHLSALKGKYVLVDFWASWCSPCRASFPHLKQLYEKYKGQGLEIIAISRDENLDSWKTAITKEGIGQWQHISIRENSSNDDWLSNNSIEKQYFVSSIPVKVLIDDNGIIVGRWRGSEGSEALEAMLEAIFSRR